MRIMFNWCWNNKDCIVVWWTELTCTTNIVIGAIPVCYTIYQSNTTHT